MTNPLGRLNELFNELNESDLVLHESTDNKSFDQFEKILARAKPFNDEKDFYSSMYPMLHNEKTIVQTRITVKENCPGLILWMKPLEILHYFRLQKLVHVKVNDEFDYTLSVFQHQNKNRVNTNKNNKLKNLENEVKNLKKQLATKENVSESVQNVSLEFRKKKKDNKTETIPNREDNTDKELKTSASEDSKTSWAKIVEESQN